MILELLNGHPKCTVIQSFCGEVTVIRPGVKIKVANIEAAKRLIEEKGWEANIAFIKGLPLSREIIDFSHKG